MTEPTVPFDPSDYMSSELWVREGEVWIADPQQICENHKIDYIYMLDGQPMAGRIGYGEEALYEAMNLNHEAEVSHLRAVGGDE